MKEEAGYKPARRRGAFIASYLAIGFMVSGLARAAEVADAGAAQSADLDEIVISAERRNENLEKVPISVTAISPKMIDDLNLQSISDLATVTPNLIYDTGYTFEQIYIRGIGAATPTGVGLESPVAVYIDGAYVTRQVGTIYDLLDPGTVEVLRGPQGTLYGHDSSGGAILLNSADPTNKFSVDGKMEYGNYGHTLEEVVLNLPVDSTLAFRIAGRYRNDDGFVYNITNHNWVRGEQGGMVRAKGKWTPTDDFSAVLTLELDKQSIHSAASGQNLATGALCAGCGPNPPSLGRYQVDENFDRHEPNESKSANLNLQYSLGKMNIRSITDFRDVVANVDDDPDHTPTPLFFYVSDYGGNTLSEDLQVSSSFGGFFDFLAGGQYIHDDAVGNANIWGDAFGLPGDSLIPADRIQARNDVFTKSYAFFAEAYLRPIDKLTVTLGARYSRDTRHIHTGLNTFAASIFNPGGSNDFSNHAEDNKVTPRVVVAYDAGFANFYASFNRGFKAGGFSVPEFNPQTVPINPETIDSYEIGAKYVSPSGRTRLNAAAFFYNYKDVQVALLKEPSQIFTNAGSAHGRGLELDLNQKVTDWLTLSAAGGYLNAKYTDYPNAVIYEPTPAGGVTIAGADLAGSTLPRAPKFTGDVAARIQVPLGSNWIGRWDTVARYTGSYLFAPAASGPLNTDRQDSYTLVNTSASVGPTSGAYELGVYVSNATNAHYYEVVALTSPWGIDAIVAPPLTFGVRFKVHFE